MNEHNFDEMLEFAMPEIPPQDIVRKTVPWRTAMNHILIGLALNILTLRLLGLHYILPAIGMILLLLGFRSLQSENAWFRLCWGLTIILMICEFFALSLGATIYQHAFYASAYTTLMKIAVTASHALLLICFWRGIAAVQQKARTDVRAGSAVALIIWYFALLGLLLLHWQGWFFAGVMILCFILVIRSLFRLSHALEKSGYALTAAPVRISGRLLTAILAVALLVGIACSHIFGGSYPMDWVQKETAQTAQIAGIKENLLSLGYPEAALNDLSDEDILLCQDASGVIVHEGDYAVNDGRDVYEMIDDHITYTETVYDIQELHLTDVLVQLDDGSSEWRIFHHFLWSDNPGFHGTEALEIRPAYQHYEGLASSGSLTGRVLYDSADGTYISPYHSLQEESYITGDEYYGQTSNNGILAGFSFPRGSERQRGYVAYGIKGTMEGWHISSQINYVHQQNILQYPAESALDSIKQGALHDSDTFITIQNALRISITEQGLEPITDE